MESIHKSQGERFVFDIGCKLSHIVLAPSRWKCASGDVQDIVTLRESKHFEHAGYGGGGLRLLSAVSGTALNTP